MNFYLKAANSSRNICETFIDGVLEEIAKYIDFKGRKIIIGFHDELKNLDSVLEEIWRQL